MIQKNIGHENFTKRFQAVLALKQLKLNLKEAKELDVARLVHAMYHSDKEPQPVKLACGQIMAMWK